MKLSDLKEQKVAVFLSGGLASWTVTRYLLKRGCQVTALWADVGQSDGEFLNFVFDDLQHAGAELIRRDFRQAVGDLAQQMIRYQAHYEGGYWNSTGALRAILVKEFAPTIAEGNFTVFSHGCVGGGNDQQRFQNYGKVFLGGVQEYSPWSDPEFREQFPCRAKMAEYLAGEKIPEKIIRERILWSTDSSLIGTSYEGEQVESLRSSYVNVTPLMGRLPWQAASKMLAITVRFEKGIVVARDEERLSPAALLKWANDSAGESGVSLKSVVENRIRGTKSKGIYESPGMDLLSFASRQLYSAAMGREELECFGNFSRLIGAKLYRGEYFDTICRSCRLACDALTDGLRGSVSVKIYKGNLICEGIQDFQPAPTNFQEKRFDVGRQFWTASSSS